MLRREYALFALKKLGMDQLFHASMNSVLNVLKDGKDTTENVQLANKHSDLINI